MDSKYKSKIDEIEEVAKNLMQRNKYNTKLELDAEWGKLDRPTQLTYLNIATTIVMGYDLQNGMGVVADRMPSGG